MDWILYDRDHRHERVKALILSTLKCSFNKSFVHSCYTAREKENCNQPFLLCRAKSTKLII